MRILFVLHTPKDPRTAVFNHVAERAAHLASLGHEVEVLAPEDFPALRHRHPRWLPLLFPEAVARRLRRLRRRGAVPDLVVFHSYTGWVHHLLGGGRGRPPGARSITQFHGLEPLHYRALVAEAARAGEPVSMRFRLFHGLLLPRLIGVSCRRSDHVLCLNRREQDEIVRRRWAAPARVTVLRNSVAAELFIDRVESRQPRRLLFLGQWLDTKGVRYLARAFATLAAERPGLELVCLGTRMPAEVVAAGLATPVAARVMVVAEASREEVLAHLAAADLFVFPTLSEGSSLALLEAMAAGLAIVTTPVGAAPDLLVDGESVLFVRPADATAIVTAVSRLLDDAELCRRLGRAARRAAESSSWPRLRDAYTALLEEIAGEGRPLRPATATPRG